MSSSGVPQKTHGVEGPMYVKYVEAQCPSFGVVWKLGEEGVSSGISDVKDASYTDMLVVENVDKITEIIEVDRHVSSRSIAQELKIGHKTVLNHLHKVGFKKKLDVWVPHQLTPKKT
ncbi:histone-lysine N-methyltransferase SETMAR [Trichonephila clavipes]|nr:histone-lysine N-methyltransferase SETMAR [Trichonephila clavipes]